MEKGEQQATLREVKDGVAYYIDILAIPLTAFGVSNVRAPKKLSLVRREDIARQDGYKEGYAAAMEEARQMSRHELAGVEGGGW